MPQLRPPRSRPQGSLNPNQRPPRAGWLAILALAVASCGSADDETASAGDELRSRCTAYRDHLVALQVPDDFVDVAAHRAALTASLGDRFVDDCVGNAVPAELACATAATSNEELSKCAPGQPAAEVAP